MKKPNILLMISHDTGRYLGCYGRPVETPALNELANNGIRFDNYYCSAPQCSPSRGSIMTGLYPHNHGMIGLAHLGFSMKPDVVTLPMALKKHNYETTLIGLSHETIDEPNSTKFSSTYDLGYDRVERVKGDRAPLIADRVHDYLLEKASSSSEQPFYASVGFFETHRDFDEYEPDPVDQVVPPDYLPDTPETREDFATLNGSVKTLDRAIGRISQSLKETGLDQNTIVIFTTDHGIAFPRAKGTMKDAGLETALIISWPGQWKGGRVQKELLCNVDLMPTILDIIQADIPDHLDGKSFLPLLEDKTFEMREAFFCELTWHDWYHPMRGIRTDRYKYVRNFEQGPAIYLPLDIHRSLSGKVVREEYYVPNTAEELYDLHIDPQEQHNLAATQEHKGILKRLREEVDVWMKETQDPLLKGKVEGIPAPDWQDEIDNGSAFAARGNQH